jgi:hypothetical protein
MRRSRTTLALMTAIASTLAAGTTLASAAPAAGEDGADTFNVAAGTTVRGTNSGVVTISGTTAAGTLTITCTVSTFSGKTGTTLKIGIAPPVFGDAAAPPCTDNFGQTDTFASNSVNGKWSVTEKDFTNNGAGDEGLPEPNATGDKMVMTIPKAGLVDTNSFAAGCTATLAPSAAIHITGKYNDAGTLTITKASVPIATSAACPVQATSATVTVTYTLSPAVFDQG